jgi:hypothetical protein
MHPVCVRGQVVDHASERAGYQKLRKTCERVITFSNTPTRSVTSIGRAGKHAPYTHPLKRTCTCTYTCVHFMHLHLHLGIGCDDRKLALHI